MKTKRFLSAAICIAISFTFFACSSSNDPDNDSGGNGSVDSTLYTCQLATGCIQATISNCSQASGEIVAVCQENGNSSSSGEADHSSSSIENDESSSSNNADPSSSSIASDESSSSVASSSSGTSSINMVGAVKAQPVASSNNMNEPKVLASWKKRNVNWYVIDVGYINYSLLMESDHLKHGGNGSVTITMSETVGESMSKSRTSTVSNSVTFFESSTVSKNIQEVYDAKVGGGINAGLWQAGASVQETITNNYGTSVTVENTQGRTTETSDGIEQELNKSKTDALSYTIDRNDPVGIYRYAWYSTNDVYFIISTSSDNKELLSWNTVSAPREIGISGLEYSEDGIFDNSPESRIVFADDFYTKLPQPQESQQECGSNYYYDSEAFCDTRDKRLYKLVEIGTQTWMAENLNLSGFGYTSVCYGNSEDYCLTHGRLYRWDAAMALSSTCNSKYCSDQVKSKHQGVCHDGWHIPNNAEWTTLMNYVGGSSTAGKALKATSGFAALMGGYYYGGYEDFDDWGYWWSASEDGDNEYDAYFMLMYNSSDAASLYSFLGKDAFLSVRCVED